MQLLTLSAHGRNAGTSPARRRRKNPKVESHPNHENLRAAKRNRRNALTPATAEIWLTSTKTIRSAPDDMNASTRANARKSATMHMSVNANLAKDKVVVNAALRWRRVGNAIVSGNVSANVNTANAAHNVMASSANVNLTAPKRPHTGITTHPRAKTVGRRSMNANAPPIAKHRRHIRLGKRAASAVITAALWGILSRR